MITPSLIAAIMSGHGGASGFVCPSYLTVTLSFVSAVYIPPVAPLINLQLLPCPYVPPIV